MPLTIHHLDGRRWIWTTHPTGGAWGFITDAVAAETGCDPDDVALFERDDSVEVVTVRGEPRYLLNLR